MSLLQTKMSFFFVNEGQHMFPCVSFFYSQIKFGFFFGNEKYKMPLKLSRGNCNVCDGNSFFIALFCLLIRLLRWHKSTRNYITYIYISISRTPDGRDFSNSFFLLFISFFRHIRRV